MPLRPRLLAAPICAALLLLGCGDDQADEPETTTTTEPELVDVEVHITATIAGFGCVQAVERSPFNIGNGLRVNLEDGTGEMLGVGTFEATPGVETCDWTAEIEDVPVDAGFYTAAAGAEMLTLSQEEMEATDWVMRGHIEIDGDVTPG